MSPRSFKKTAEWVVLAALVSPPSVTALGIHRDHTALQSSYDYVVAGGGVAGLVVANRLSENPNGVCAVQPLFRPRLQTDQLSSDGAHC